MIELLGRHCRGDAQRWECGLPSNGVLPDSDVFAIERAYLAGAHSLEALATYMLTSAELSGRVCCSTADGCQSARMRETTQVSAAWARASDVTWLQAAIAARVKTDSANAKISCADSRQGGALGTR